MLPITHNHIVLDLPRQVLIKSCVAVLDPDESCWKDFVGKYGWFFGCLDSPSASWECLLDRVIDNTEKRPYYGFSDRRNKTLLNGRTAHVLFDIAYGDSVKQPYIGIPSDWELQ